MSKNFYKVFNHDRSLRKGVVAKNFKDVVQKGNQKLAYDATEAVTVVIDYDGTEVPDQEYFATLPKGTTLMFLRTGESWAYDRVRDWPTNYDTPDGSTEEPFAPEEIESVLHMLRGDITKIVTLDKQELHLLTCVDQSHLAHFLNVPLHEAVRIQGKCQQYLDDLQDSQECLDLIQMMSSQASSGSSSLQLDTTDGSTAQDPHKDGRPRRKRTRKS